MQAFWNHIRFKLAVQPDRPTPVGLDMSVADKSGEPILAEGLAAEGPDGKSPGRAPGEARSGWQRGELSLQAERKCRVPRPTVDWDTS